MAGAALKTTGGILTTLGAAAAILGLVVAVVGLQQLDGEAQRLAPSEQRAQDGAKLGLAGAAVLGMGAALLLVGLVPLVAGFHRTEDAQLGRVRTRRGGYLTGFGVSFLVVGALALLVATVCFVYSSNVMSEEEGRVLENDGRRDLAEGLFFAGTASSIVAGVLLVLALPLLVSGRVRAAGDPAPAPVAGEPVIALPPPAVTSSRRATSSALLVAGGLAFASFLVVGLFATLGGTTIGALGTDDGPGTAVERLYEGELSGGRLPTGATVGAGAESAVHEITPETTYGIVEAALGWEPGPTRAELELVLEMETASGRWERIGGSQNPEPGVVSFGPMSVTGPIRATVSFASGSGGQDVSYELLLRVLPSR